ncbi:O-antigen ligase family protein [Terribacillus sp. DMT04]|uniref:O-antigen ligase family protein n=1 Tax=Terribacillus sp. DMT04 TaxID=2850441 RepID=UPI001C2BDDAB|nr:O-antigen ligase family protein [Terribacillus sp. DMT04]QXE01114.1 O-antigen ligase family protein [Terribacillus sp. DMT04]
MQALMQRLKDNHHTLEKLFIFFILAQPFLDLLAYFSIPVSNPIRLLVIPIGMLYMLSYPDRRWSRNTFIYMAVLAVYFAANFAVNMVWKDPVSAVGELTFILKTFFFITALLVYVMIFRHLGKNRDWKVTVPKYLFINTSVVSVVMLIAELTGTGKRSYDYLAKQGHSGWFFSGNEISAILGMGFCGAIIYYLFVKKGMLAQIICTALVAVMIWAMLTIGTKVAFGAALVVLGFAFVLLLVQVIVKRSNLIQAGVVLVLLAVTIFVTPEMPIGNNLGLSVEMANEKAQQQEEALETAPLPEEVEEGEVPPPGSVRQWSSWQLMALNGREEYFGTVLYYFEHAPVIQKVFGMGIGGNYTGEQPRIIEMDILDWFFGFGYLGTFILILPLLFVIGSILVFIFKQRFRTLHASALFTGAGACIGLGAAFIAGHILSSPASGFYLALLLGFLYGLLRQKPEKFFQ